MANVSTFEFPIILEGVMHKAAGIQSVMTHPDYRKKGLMNTLMKKALKEIDKSYNLSFLVTSDPSLYKKYGFRILNEYFYVKDYNHKGSQCGDLKSIDVFDSHDLKKIQDLFKKNVPSSSAFYPVNYEHSFYLNMYNPNMKNLVYYSASLDLVVLYEVLDNKLELFDVIGSSLPDLDKICSLIPEPFHEINFFSTLINLIQTLE